MENNTSESAKDDSDSQTTTTTSDSSTSTQFLPNTPTQKPSTNSTKRKTPKYLRNASIKLLTHPVDKNIAWSFLLSIIFAAISVLTGFPTVIALMWILAIALGLRILFARCCIHRRSIRGSPDVEGQQVEHESSTCLRAEDFVRPPESLWLHDSSFNLHVSHCLFYLDPGLNCSKLKDVIRMRILNKTTEYGKRAFPRFLQKVVPVCSGYCWVDDEDFSLENHIYNEKRDIKSNDDLQDHISTLMCQPMLMSRPLWEIRLIKDFGRSKDTVLLIRVHQAVSDAITLVVILGNYLSDNQQLLRLKSRFGSATYFLNLFRALFVAPLTFLGWLLFRRRDYNFFNRRHKPQSRVVAWSHNIRFSKVLRIKQVMRCSMNDVFVSATSGAVRAYFTKHGISNPPNVTLSLPVDLRRETGGSPPRMGSRFSQVSLRLPCSTEGAVPRLWEVRRRTEELKTSPDTAVWYAAVYCLLNVLPECAAHWIINTVINKATVLLSNVPGPEEPLSIGCRRLKRIVFWMSPRPEIPVVFSVISYAGYVQLSVAADKMVVQQPDMLIKEFEMENTSHCKNIFTFLDKYRKSELTCLKNPSHCKNFFKFVDKYRKSELTCLKLKRLSHLLARRRIPGEHRRRSHFTEERRQAEIINPPDGELQLKLYSVQEEIHHVSVQLSAMLGDRDTAVHPFRAPETRLLQKLDELKEEFSELMRELRRRKSLADGIVLDNQDEDMDGELRRPRRLALSSSGRRASLHTLLASTTRPLATPTISHHSFVVSTPNLQATAEAASPTHPRATGFLQVAQERSGRRKSDFN